MAAPLTPPGGSSSSAHPSAPGPVTLSSAYNDISARAVSKKWAELTRVAETADLLVLGEKETRFLITAPLVLAYLIVDDLPPANHALRQLSKPLQGHAIAQALFGLLAAVWDRNYQHVYPRAEALVVAVESGSLKGDLGPLVVNLVENFLDAFRTRTFLLLSKAYSSLTIDLAQNYLGLPSDKVLSTTQAHGWSYDNASQKLVPKVASVNLNANNKNAPSSLITLRSLTELGSKLESIM